MIELFAYLWRASFPHSLPFLHRNEAVSYEAILGGEMVPSFGWQTTIPFRNGINNCVTKQASLHWQPFACCRHSMSSCCGAVPLEDMIFNS